MSAAILDDVMALPRDEKGPTFDSPWQAQIFALTVELHKAGYFTWPDWVECFSQEIKAEPALQTESTNDAYYRQWQVALETMVTSRRLVAAGDIGLRAEEWRKAYLNTPHGQPILMINASCPPHHDHDHDHDHAPQRAPIAVSPARANQTQGSVP